jgi:hypothetical protein
VVIEYPPILPEVTSSLVEAEKGEVALISNDLLLLNTLEPEFRAIYCSRN